ncbi:hypothetical protein NDU88_005975 [Pleurodeles waltl]|uniref:Uncharacterized protein n=1 Tax=Pleurodeles waltl TaxID=8319 RepID=A0AAV7PH82_PLEWA|nr:hypothetical protein NDU88_005975 [Pleurodeles waltl]
MYQFGLLKETGYKDSQKSYLSSIYESSRLRTPEILSVEKQMRLNDDILQHDIKDKSVARKSKRKPSSTSTKRNGSRTPELLTTESKIAFNSLQQTRKAKSLSPSSLLMEPSKFTKVYTL